MTNTSPHPAESPAVFISYSRDLHPEGGKIAALAQRLRASGYACDFDGFHATFRNGWRRDVLDAMREAQFVLLVCDPTYREKFEAKSTHEDSGVRWEADEIIRQIPKKGYAKFIPVAFTRADAKHVPSVLSEQTRFILPDEYELLLKRLRNEGPFAAAPIGTSGDASLATLFPASVRERIRAQSDWVIDRILRDQYSDGPGRGAWSRDYPKYQRDLYGRDDLVPESITCSAWIALALRTVRDRASRSALRIANALLALETYVAAHQDPTTGGFGRLRSTMSDDSIQAHARHTAWAMIALHATASMRRPEMLANGGAFIRRHLEKNHASTVPAITTAAIQRVLADPNLGPFISDSPEERRRLLLTEVEPAIAALYDPKRETWDVKYEPACAAIDNVLFVLYSLAPPITDELRNVMNQATRNLWRLAKDVGPGKVALPWRLRGGGQLGASAVLLWITMRDNLVDQIGRQNVRSLMEFVVSAEARRRQPGFTWDLASILLIDSAMGMDE
jgi:hypothetical protein